MRIPIKRNFAVLADPLLGGVAFGVPIGLAIIHEHEELNPPWACTRVDDGFVKHMTFECPYCNASINIEKSEMDKLILLARMIG